MTATQLLAYREQHAREFLRAQREQFDRDFWRQNEVWERIFARAKEDKSNG